MSGNTEKADGGWAGLARDQRSAFWQALEIREVPSGNGWEFRRGKQLPSSEAERD